MGGVPPEFVKKDEYALRCILVHFEIQSCHIVSLQREYLPHVN